MMTIGVYCVNRETGARYVKVARHEVVPSAQPEERLAFKRCGCPQAPGCWEREKKVSPNRAEGSECNG